MAARRAPARVLAMTTPGRSGATLDGRDGHDPNHRRGEGCPRYGSLGGGRSSGRRPETEVVTMTAARVPPNFFGMPFGLAGLGVTWLTMANYGRVPQAVGDILLAAAAVAWLIVLAGYLRYILSVRSALVRDLLDPVAAPF